MDVTAWLAGLGLSQYGEVFDENGIDAEVLPDLTGDDLKDMGITAVGHRSKLLNAIEALGEGPSNAEIMDQHTGRNAERRQMTLLFCDIVSSTDSVSILDPEESREVITGFVNMVQDAAKEHAGYVAKFMGDGALVYFGYPNALENNAEAAMRTGLDIIDRASAISWPNGNPVSVRVGAATGRVVVGDVIGHGAAREISVVGDTAHLAARLQSKAEPGQLLIDDRSRRMLGELMVMDPMGFQELKGFERPITVWNVTGRKDARSRFVALRAGQMTKLVGRDSNMSSLIAACDSAATGTGSILTVAGEPGIGKSRVVHELSDAALARDMDVMSWFCSPTESSTAYAPIIGHYALSIDAEDEAQRKDQLATALVQTDSDAEEVSALFERLLGLPASSDILQDYSPPRLRRRTIEALVEQIIARAHAKPLLLVLEDYHWVDPSTAELMQALVDQAADLPVVIVTTYRAEIDDPWSENAAVNRINLDRIDPQGGAEMVRRVSGATQLSDAQIASIVEKAEGVPLFIEELTRTVLDGDGDTIGEVPDTLQDALMARVDRLAPMRHTIQTAALLGRDFDIALLTRVLEEPRVEVMDAMFAMQEANIVARVDGALEGTYRFQHALIQDVMADSLLRSVRSGLHLKIGGLLAGDINAGIPHSPELVGSHFERGGEPMAAMGWYITAGQQAVERFANMEAVAHLDKALALSKSAPAPEIQAGAELGISGLKGVALTMMQGWAAPSVGEVYTRAYDLWDIAGGGAETFPTAVGLLSYSIVRGDLDEALQMAENAVKIAEAAENPEWVMAAEHERGCLHLYKGNVEKGDEFLQRCWDLYDHDTHRAHMQFTGKNQGLFSLFHRGLSFGLQGRAAEAMAQAKLSIDLTETVHNAFTECFARLGSVALMSSLHDADSVLEHVDDALAFSNQEGFPHMIAQGLCMKGWALCIKGDPGAGLPLLGEGTGMWRGIGAGLRLGHYLGFFAEGHLAAGNVEAGLEVAEDSLQVIARTGEHLQEPDVLRIKADLLVLAGKEEAAEHFYRMAIAQSEKMGTHIYTWRAKAHLGKLLMLHGSLDEGKALIDGAMRNFEEAGMPWDVADAAALLNAA